MVKSYTASQARARFGTLLADAQRGPVRVTRRGQAGGVMLAAQDYEVVRAFYADRLRKTMNMAAEHTARSGLTPQMVDDLLADES